jgi:hypothetical protein
MEYYSEYLKIFPTDIEMWENFMEVVIVNKDFDLARKHFAENPDLKLKSGILAAFYGKCLETLVREGGASESERVYQAYLNGLKMYPADPTLLVYLGDWINIHRNFVQAYQDLRAIASPSTELIEYIHQLKKLAQDEGFLNSGQK